MFIRVKKIGPYEYLYLVENTREGGRHVQRVIKALGRRDVVENSDLLDGLIASAGRPLPAVQSCCPASIVANCQNCGGSASDPISCSAGCGRRPGAAMSCTACWANVSSASTSS